LGEQPDRGDGAHGLVDRGGRRHARHFGRILRAARFALPAEAAQRPIDDRLQLLQLERLEEEPRGA
jgi:hypothetical protein